MDLRLGDYREVLADVTCNTVITDCPYSAKTHDGHATMTNTHASNFMQMQTYKAANGGVGATGPRRQLGYTSWDRQDVADFCDFWVPRCSGWIVTVTDHLLARDWETELCRHGRYVFAPVPFLEVGKQPRMSGDGPASWTCWVVVARPKSREFSRWGSLPGGYVLPLGYKEHTLVAGGKPSWLMRALVRDYSRPGDLVCDPCAGGGTTLLAAAQTGRRAVGAELSPETHAKALKRLANTPVTTDLLDTLQAQQMGLL